MTSLVLRSLRHLAMALLLGAAGAIVTGVALEAEARAAHTVEVVLVEARRGAASMDDALASFARDLKGLPFQSFQKKKGNACKAEVGAANPCPLGDYAVTATLDRVGDEGVAVSVVVKREGKVVAKTTFERPWGRSHVLTVGRSGDATLLVPVRITK